MRARSGSAGDRVTVPPGAGRATVPCRSLAGLNLPLVSLPLRYPAPNGLASAGGAEETTQGERKAAFLLLLLIEEFVSITC